MHFKILGKRLYSSSLKDVTWLEDIQLIFLIFHTSVCIFFPANRIYPAKFADMIMEYNNKDYRINKWGEINWNSNCISIHSIY